MSILVCPLAANFGVQHTPNLSPDLTEALLKVLRFIAEPLFEASVSWKTLAVLMFFTGLRFIDPGFLDEGINVQFTAQRKLSVIAGPTQVFLQLLSPGNNRTNRITVENQPCKGKRTLLMEKAKKV